LIRSKEYIIHGRKGLDLICQKSTNITKIPVDEFALGTCAFFFFMPAYTDEKLALRDGSEAVGEKERGKTIK